MGVKKGMTNNPNGRPKGSQNKATAELRGWVNDFVNSQRDQIVNDWQVLDPKDRVVMFEKLLRYVMPALQATTIQTDFERMTDEQLDRVINELKQQVQ